MKKLLILTLVLGLATLSSASTMVFGVDGVSGTDLQASTAYTGQIIFVDTDGTSFNDTGFRVAISIVGATAYDAGDLNTILTGGIPKTGNVYDPAQMGIAIGPVEGFTATAGPYMVDDMVLYDFSFTTGLAGTVITLDDVQLTGTPPWGGAPIGYDTKINGQTTINMEAAAFDVVPEPMTLALLGLGGLFIRRRK